MKKLRSVGTHDGSFHADEVTACALLLKWGLVDRDKIVRTRDPEKLANCEYVCDVGGVYDPKQKLFDHHQADYQGALSSAGMILLYLLKEGKMPHDEYQLLNNSIILGVDAHDNGVEAQLPGVCTYSQLISNFTPIEYDSSPEVQDAAFFQALDFASAHLERLIERYRYIHSFKNVVEEAMIENKECLLFDRSIPWMDCFFDLDGEKHPAKFIVMPSGNHWKLRCIPPNARERMKVRVPLPDAWAGLLDADLKKATGIPGAIFCHKGRFFSIWETREDAMKALELTFKDMKRV